MKWFLLAFLVGCGGLVEDIPNDNQVVPEVQTPEPTSYESASRRAPRVVVSAMRETMVRVEQCVTAIQLPTAEMQWRGWVYYGDEDKSFACRNEQTGKSCAQAINYGAPWACHLGVPSECRTCTTDKEW